MPRGVPNSLPAELADHATRAEIVALRVLDRKVSAARDLLDRAREMYRDADAAIAAILSAVKSRAAEAEVFRAAAEAQARDLEGGIK